MFFQHSKRNKNVLLPVCLKGRTESQDPSSSPIKMSTPDVQRVCKTFCPLTCASVYLVFDFSLLILFW